MTIILHCQLPRVQPSDLSPAAATVAGRRTGEPLDWIYKAELDPAQPNVVVLHTTSPPTDDVALYYGAGVAPYVNIVDENDMAVPAFGPVEVR